MADGDLFIPARQKVVNTYVPKQYIPIPFEHLNRIADMESQRADRLDAQEAALKAQYHSVQSDPYTDNIIKQELDKSLGQKIKEGTQQYLEKPYDFNRSRFIQDTVADFIANPLVRVAKNNAQLFSEYNKQKQELEAKGEYHPALDPMIPQIKNIYQKQKQGTPLNPEDLRLNYGGMEGLLDHPKKANELMGKIASDVITQLNPIRDEYGNILSYKNQFDTITSQKVKNIADSKVESFLGTKEGRQWARLNVANREDPEEVFNKASNFLYQQATEQIFSKVNKDFHKFNASRGEEQDRINANRDLFTFEVDAANNESQKPLQNRIQGIMDSLSDKETKYTVPRENYNLLKQHGVSRKQDRDNTYAEYVKLEDGKYYPKTLVDKAGGTKINRDSYEDLPQSEKELLNNYDVNIKNYKTELPKLKEKLKQFESSARYSINTNNEQGTNHLKNIIKSSAASLPIQIDGEYLPLSSEETADKLGFDSVEQLNNAIEHMGDPTIQTGGDRGIHLRTTLHFTKDGKTKTVPVLLPLPEKYQKATQDINQLSKAMYSLQPETVINGITGNYRVINKLDKNGNYISTYQLIDQKGNIISTGNTATLVKQSGEDLAKHITINAAKGAKGKTDDTSYNE